MPEEPQIGDWRGFQEFLNAKSKQAKQNEFGGSPTMAGRAPSSRIESGIPNAPDAKYDQGYLPGDDIRQTRQGNQSGWDVFSNAMENIATSVPLEMMESVSSLVGQAFESDSNDFIEGQNTFQDFFRTMKETALEDSPIYASEEDQLFNPLNAMSWATNAPSIASTFSLLIPGFGIGGLAGKLGFKAAKAFGASEKVAKAAKAITATAAATPASRYMENLLEGYGTFQEGIIAGLIEKGEDPDLVESIAASLIQNPEAALKGEYAKEFQNAADAAAKTVQWNWGAAIPDALQYALAFGVGKGLKVPKHKVPSGASKLKASKMFSEETMKKLGQKTGTLITQAGSEGAEEAYQYIVSKEALNSEEMFGGDFESRLHGYLADDELWSSALMGAVMGAGFTAGGGAIKKVQDRMAKAAINNETARNLSNYTYESDARDLGLIGSVRRAYLENESLDKVIAKVTKLTEKQAPEERTKLTSDLLGTVQELNVYAKELEAQGYSQDQIADKISMDMLSTLKGYSKEENLQTFNNHIKNAVERNMVPEEYIKSFEAKTKVDAIEKVLKKYPEKNVANQAPETTKFLDGLRAQLPELKEEAKAFPKDIPTPRQAEKAQEAYLAYIHDSLTQVTSMSMGAKALVNDPEYIRKKEEAAKEAGNTAAKNNAKSVHIAESESQIEDARNEEKSLTGDTKKTDAEIKKAANKNNTTWKDIVGTKEDTTNLAQKIAAAYTNNKRFAAFVQDKQALGDALGQEMPKNINEFAQLIESLFNEGGSKADIITSYYKNRNQKPTKVEKTEKGSKTAPTGDKKAPGHTEKSYQKTLSNIFVSASQWIWGANKMPAWGEDGYYVHNKQKYPDDPVVDYGRLDQLGFDPRGWNVSVRVNPARQANQNDSEISIEVWGIHPETEEEVFLGHLQKKEGGRIYGDALHFRNYIESQYASAPKDTVYVAPLTFQVKDKLKGKVYNRNVAKHPEFWVSPQEVVKDGPVQMITVVVSNDGTPKWGGTENLAPEVQEQVEEFKINQHGINGKGEQIGGYVYLVLKGTNGEYLSAQMFTRYLNEVAEEQDTVNSLVDLLFDKNYTKEQKDFLIGDIKDIVHTNHDSSNRKIVLDEMGVPMWMAQNEEGEWQEAEYVSNEELKNKLGESIFYIDADVLNSDPRNERYSKLVKTDINPNLPVHSTSFTIEQVLVEEQPIVDEVALPTPVVEGDGTSSLEGIFNQSVETPTSAALKSSGPSNITNIENEIDAVKNAKTKEELIKASEQLIGMNPYDAGAVSMGTRALLLTPGSFEKGKTAFLEEVEGVVNQKRKNNTNTTDTTLDLFDNIDLDPTPGSEQNPAKPMSSKLTDVGDVGKEKERVSKVLGNSKSVKEFSEESQIPITPETTNVLTNVKRKGEILQGLFTEAGLYLRTKGVVGRGYHEAFHVIFTLGLTPGQRSLLLDETRKQLKNESLTDLEVEEYLAEEFRKESLLRDSMTLTEKAKDVLMALWANVKGFFNPTSKIHHKTLFRDMYFGKYAGTVNFNRSINKFTSSKAMITGANTTIAGVDYVAMQEFKEVFQEEYHIILDALRKSNIANKSTKGTPTDAELIMSAAKAENINPVQYLKNTIARALINRMKVTRNPTFVKIFQGYYPSTKINPTSDEDVSGIHLVVRGSKVDVQEPSALQTDALLSLRKFGLDVNLDKGDFMVKTYEEDSEDSNIEDKDFEKEGHIRNRQQEDTREKAKDFLKRMISRIPKYSIKGDTVDNQFGVTKREDLNIMFSNLEMEISNSTSQESMMNKLDALARKYNWAKDVRTMAEESEEFQKNLWLGIGGMWLTAYFGINQAGVTYVSNRRNALNYISKDISSTFLNPANPLLKGSSYNINTDSVRELLLQVKGVRDALYRAKKGEQTTKNNNGETVTINSLLEDLGKILTNHYINIDGETLVALRNESKSHEDFLNKVFVSIDARTGKWTKGDNRYNGIEGFILKMYESSSNPFVGYESQEISENAAIVRKLGQLLEKAWPHKTQATFMNSDGERTYALTEPTYLSQKIEQFKDPSSKILERFKVGFLKAAPILEDLQYASFRDKFGLKVLDGSNIDGQKRSYKKMTYTEMGKVLIDAYLNKSRPTTALIPIPIPADSSMLPFIEYPKLSTNNGEVYNKLYKLAQMEKKRINNYEADAENTSGESLNDLKYYGQEAGSFQYLAFLNKPEYQSLNYDDVGGKLAVISAIKEELEKEVNETYSELNKAYPNEYSLTQVREYIANYTYYQSQTITLLHKDPSNYKSIGDFFKRAKQLGAPGMTPGDNNGRQINAIVIDDYVLPNENAEAIAKLASQDPITQALHKKENDITDGFTYASPGFYREFADSVGKWSYRQEQLYQKYITNADLNARELRDLFPPIKPYYFSEFEHAGELIPMQMKNSIHVLTTEFVAMNSSNPKLAKAQELLNGDIDIVTFDSTIKVGKFKVSDKNDETKTGTYKALKDIEDAGANGAVVTINMNDLRWQQDNPSHWFEYSIKIGSQLRTLITSGITAETVYDVEGQSLTGKEIIDLYEGLIESIYSEQLDTLYKDVDVEKGQIDPIKDKIVAMAYDRGAASTDLQSLRDTIVDAAGNIIPNLFGSQISDLSKSLAASVFKKKVWTQSMPGGQFVNVASYGVAENLNYEIDEARGIVNMEVYLPAWTESLLRESMKENGNIDPKVMELIGYRIPTESKYSVFNMRVKGFLPTITGGSVIMPREVTKIAGLDFDIDKIFVFTPNHSYNKDTQTVEADRFDYTKSDKGFDMNQPLKSRQNGLIDVLKAIMRNKAHAAEALGPGHFVNLKSLSGAFFLRDQGRKNPKEFGRYAEMSLAQLKALDKQDIIDSLEKATYNAVFPRTQQEFHERNATGEALIGVTANHRTHAAKSERTDLKLNKSMMLEGSNVQNLNMYEGPNGIIGKNLEQFSAAMVDNAKDPTAPFLNFNIHTADMAMAMLRLGLSMDYTLAFLTHPTVVAAVNKANENNSSLGRAARDLYKKATDHYAKDIVVTDIPLNDLFTDTSENNPSVLLNLIELQQVGAELSRLISATKTDATPPASNSGKLWTQMNNIRKVMVNQYEYLDNTADFFDKTKVRLTWAPYEYAYKSFNEFYNKFFPYLRSNFSDVKKAFEARLPNYSQLSADEATRIDNNLVSYHLSSHPLIKDIKNRRKFLEDTYAKVRDYKTDMSPEYALLFAQLELVPTEVGKGTIDRIEYNRTSLGDETLDNLRGMFLGMYQQGSATEKSIARDLIKYALLTAQEQNTYTTFYSLIHPELLKGENSINELKSRLVIDDINFLPTDFMNQYVRNNTASPLIPMIPKKEAKRSKDGKALLVDKNNFQLVKRSNFIQIDDGVSYTNADNMVPYVKVSKGKQGYDLYEYQPAADGAQHSWYTKVDQLGIPNFAYEYYPGEFNPTSTLIETKDTPKASEVAKETEETGDMEEKFSGKTTVIKLDDVVHGELTVLYDSDSKWFNEQGIMSKEDFNELTDDQAGELFKKYCNRK